MPEVGQDLPCSHTMQEPFPMGDLNFPAGQSSQTLCSLCDWNFPAGQSLQNAPPEANW